MNENESSLGCPCDSGLLYSECCGVEDRSAVNADIRAIVSMEGIAAERQLTPQIQSSIASISESQDLFPARINFFENKAWFVKMSPRWYRESVFLDPGRIKGTFVIEADLTWLQEVSTSVAWQPTAFIFHTAFCGSTLMSQALDVIFNSLSLREPEVLGNALVYQRSNANDEQKNTGLDCVLRLLSRRYESDQPVVVKANDYANPLMLALTNSQYQTPILFMYTPLSEFLVGCLKAKNRREWIAQRYKSIGNAIPQWLSLPADLSINEDAYGKMAAVYWCYNIALYLEVSRRSNTQVCSLDFNHMLANPLESVTAAGKLFGLDQLGNVNVSEQIQRLFGVYSKNSKFAYSPEQRDSEIKTLLKDNQAQLEQAEQLAQHLLGNRYPSLGLPGNLLAP